MYETRRILQCLLSTGLPYCPAEDLVIYLLLHLYAIVVLSCNMTFVSCSSVMTIPSGPMKGCKSSHRGYHHSVGGGCGRRLRGNGIELDIKKHHPFDEAIACKDDNTTGPRLSRTISLQMQVIEGTSKDYRLLLVRAPRLCNDDRSCSRGSGTCGSSSRSVRREISVQRRRLGPRPALGAIWTMFLGCFAVCLGLWSSPSRVGT